MRGMVMAFDRKWLAIGVVLALLAFAGGAKYESVKAERNKVSLQLLRSDEDHAAKKTAASPDKGIITVYVTGEVKRPGVYRLRKGDRVYQAIEMAGGVLESADMKNIPMARKISDEETVYVPSPGETQGQLGTTTSTNLPAQPSSSGSQGGLININTASVAELDTLDGIGPTLAQRIIDFRTTNGSFSTIEDINNVSGIGDKKYEAIKNSITVR